ncbi:MAG: TIGR00289 family protein [Aciduliprofundum sp.]|nr:MAG: TIGR00289 family protein [Aciduliprofundum sp.]
MKKGANMDGISLISGGKDSLYAMYIAMQQGINIKKIVNIIPERYSFMYHFPNAELVNYIAKSIGIPFFQFRISDEPYELKKVLSEFDEKIVTSGAIASEYQKTRIDSVCYELGKIHYAPLWRKDPFQLLDEILDAQLKTIFISVSAEGLGEEFLGRVIDRETIDILKKLNERYGIHPSGEGGEYETLVIDSPIYKKSLKIVESDRKWEGGYGILEIKKIMLIDKF